MRARLVVSVSVLDHGAHEAVSPSGDRFHERFAVRRVAQRSAQDGHGSFDLASRLIAADTFLAGTLRHADGKWSFST